MRGYPQFSVWILITLAEICFSHIFIKPRKNTFELVGTVLNDMLCRSLKNMCMLERDTAATFSAFPASASLKTVNNFALALLFCFKIFSIFDMVFLRQHRKWEDLENNTFSSSMKNPD